MTHDPSSRGRPPTRTVTDRDAATAVDGVVDRLADSASGLRRAAGVVGDDGLTHFLTGLAERRDESRASLAATARDAGLRLTGDQTGSSLVERLRRGWMRLEAVVDGDESVIGTAIDEERDLLGEVDQALALPLAESVLAALRTISGEIGADITSLQEWRRARGES